MSYLRKILSKVDPSLSANVIAERLVQMCLETKTSAGSTSMAVSQVEKPIFFSIRKNSSYFMWRPYGKFFNFGSVCIEPLGEDAFALYESGCLKVQQLGRKYLVSSTRYRRLRNGIYLLEGEKDGRYVFVS